MKRRRLRSNKQHNWLGKPQVNDAEANLQNGARDPSISGERRLWGEVIEQGFRDLKSEREKPGRESEKWHDWVRFFTAIERRKDLEIYCWLADMDVNNIVRKAKEVIERRGRGEKIGRSYAKPPTL